MRCALSPVGVTGSPRHLKRVVVEAAPSRSLRDARQGGLAPRGLRSPGAMKRRLGAWVDHDFPVPRGSPVVIAFPPHVGRSAQRPVSAAEARAFGDSSMLRRPDELSRLGHPRPPLL